MKTYKCYKINKVEGIGEKFWSVWAPNGAAPMARFATLAEAKAFINQLTGGVK